MKNRIIDCLTGQITTVDATAQEIAQMETDNSNHEIMVANAEAEATAKADLKASAKAKLISGEALTEDEANTIVL